MQRWHILGIGTIGKLFWSRITEILSKEETLSSVLKWNVDMAFKKKIQVTRKKFQMKISFTSCASHIKWLFQLALNFSGNVFKSHEVVKINNQFILPIYLLIIIFNDPTKWWYERFTVITSECYFLTFKYWNT